MKIEPLSIRMITQIRILRQQGHSIRNIASMTGISNNSIIKYSQAALASDIIKEKVSHDS